MTKFASSLATTRCSLNIHVIAPWRIWDLTSRSKLITYAERRGIPIPVSREKPYSTDRNVLHISYEGGILEDPWREPYTDMFLLTVAPEQAPDKAEYVEIDFEAGNPIRGRRCGILASRTANGPQPDRRPPWRWAN